MSGDVLRVSDLGELRAIARTFARKRRAAEQAFQELIRLNRELRANGGFAHVPRGASYDSYYEGPDGEAFSVGLLDRTDRKDGGAPIEFGERLRNAMSDWRDKAITVGEAERVYRKAGEEFLERLLMEES